MRTVRTKVYKFGELSAKAKQRAIEDWRNEETYDWIYEEAWESLKKFSEVFDIKMRDYDFSEPYRSHYSYELDDKIIELSGQRLATYIWNNYRGQIYKGKYYGKLVYTFKDGSPIPVSKEHPAGCRHVLRYSKCTIEEGCPFTGVCYDQDLLDPIYKFLRKPDKRDFKELLEDCLSSLNKSVQGEIEGNSEDDAISDTIISNEYEFTADGRRF
jgi:hypothetical protein